MKLQKSETQDFSIDIDEVLSALDKVKKSGKNQWVALCPSHNDTRQSLSVGTTSDGKALLYCHANCSYLDIIQSLGLYKEPSPTNKKEISEIYDYVDESGELLFQTLRFIPKNFGQRRPDGAGGWIYNLKGVRRVLYRLPELINTTDETVFIVEGEKAVDFLRDKGFVATTNPLGGSKWAKDYNKYFKGKDVVVIGDNDDTGVKHVETVSKNIFPVANSVKIITLDGVKEHGGVDDWFALSEDNNAEKLKTLVLEASTTKYDEDELELDESLPSFYDGEYSIIGAVFKNPKLISKVIDADSLKDFYFPKTKAVLKAILDCHSNKEGIDIVTVSEKLRLNGKLEQVGGIKFLKETKEDVPDTLNIDTWISTVKGKSDFRSYIKIGDKLKKVAQQEQDNPQNIGDELTAELFKIRNKGKKETFVQVAEPVWKIIEQTKNLTGNAVTGLSTGFTALDEITGGYQKTDLIIIAGVTSIGKTALGLNTAVNAALLSKANVAFFSLEMSKEQLIKRVLCSEARVDGTNFRTGNLDKNDWARLANVIPKLENSGLYINDTPAISVFELRNETHKFLDIHGSLDLVMVDYLQLMSGNARETRQQEISQISRELKALAKELDVPVVAFSQLSRGVEKRTPPKPIMADLRESGAIEQDADVIAFVYRDDYYNPANEESKGLAEIIVAKQRNGETGTIDLAFLKKYSRFENLFPMEYKVKI